MPGWRWSVYLLPWQRRNSEDGDEDTAVEGHVADKDTLDCDFNASDDGAKKECS